MEENSGERKISVFPEKCQCCWICVMRCGLRFDKMINPKASKMAVDPVYGLWPKIYFSEECDLCGICARHCPTGAISLTDTGSERIGGMGK